MTKTLRQALAECTDKQLEQMIHLWGMDGEKHDNPKYIYDTLIKRAKEPIAARFVWEYLARDEREVLYNVLTPAARYGIQSAALQKKLAMTDERYTAAVDHLVQCLLIQEKALTVHPVISSPQKLAIKEVLIITAVTESLDSLYKTGREMFKGPKNPASLPLAKLLAPLTSHELNLIIKSYHVQWDRYYDDPRTMIIQTLLELEDSLSVALNLDQSARTFFAWLRDKGGQATMQEVRIYTGASDAALLQILSALSRCALVFDTFSNLERVVFIPQELCEVMNIASQSSQRTVLRETTQPPPLVHTAETATLYDLAIMVGMIYQLPIEPTQSGPMPKRIAAKIRPLMHGKERMRYSDEDLYLDMLLRIARDLGIVLLSEPLLDELKPRYEPGPLLDEWSKLDSVGQSRLLLQQWTSKTHWLDIYGANFRSWSPYGYDWGGLEGRTTLLKHLEQCTPGCWYSISSLLQRIWEEDPFTMRPVRPYSRAADRSKTREARANWMNSEGEAYIGMLASTLSEFGMVDVGISQPSLNEELRNPDTFQLTELGAAVLKPPTPSPTAQKLNGTAAEPASDGVSKQRTLVIQPNFELLLLQPDFPTLYSLLPFVQINQIGLVSRFTLTRTSLLRGLEGENSVGKIVRILEEHSQKELPQNVLYSLNDWAKSYKEASISQVLLFEVSSEATADQLSRIKKLREAGLRQIAPCVLIVDGVISLQEIQRLFDKEGIVAHINGKVDARKVRY